MDKSPEAFRTISEVAETLETPAHVLRFWESRFPQIRPVKRAGGRRYYRPADIVLLTGIKRLLHDEGLTIRGVQKILREQGIRHVSGLAGMSQNSLALFDPAVALEEAMAERFGLPADDPVTAAEVETAQIFALETALRRVAPEPKPAVPDLFDYSASAKPAAPEAPDPALPHVAERAPTVLVAPVDASRVAGLRALPSPLPDALRAVLLPLRDRIALHRDRLREAARTGSREV